MAYGSVSVPAVSTADIEKAIEDLKAEMMVGELSVPLASADGATILTIDGEEIIAVQTIAAASVESKIASAISAVSDRVDTIHTEYSRAIIAV